MSQMDDEYIGRKYGSLTVIKRVDDYVSPKGVKSSRYLCLCDCGNEYITRGGWLKCGKSISCSECSQKRKSSSMAKDLTGKLFGRWKVLNKATTDKKGVYWNCVCSCGNTGVIRGTSLTSGNSTSCGCFASEKLRDDRLIDLKGQKFGRLLVLERVEDFISSVNGKHRGRWKCQCDCGNLVEVNTSDLTSGNTLSCGCYKSDRTSEVHFEDISGQTFGMLTIVRRVEDYVSPDSGRSRPQFLCKCSCGNEKIITKDSLMNGTISCGCINSRGEREIADYLRKHNIKFEIQYSFKDLLGIGDAPLHFDFAVFNDSNIIALIEYQGEQHYQPVSFFGGDNKFEKQSENDNRKRNYCKDNGIKLIEIPYTESVNDVLDRELLVCTD